MEHQALELLTALAPVTLSSPVAAAYGQALLVAGRNLDRAESTRDPAKVDRALDRWLSLLARMAPAAAVEGGGGDGATEFDRYAAAVQSSSDSGAQLGHPPVPGPVD
jgi:hypothetical protein